MSNYSIAIKNFNTDLLEFLHKYEIIDDKDPITNDLLKKLKKLINSLNTISNQHNLVLSKQVDLFDEGFARIMDEYKNKEKIINERLANAIQIINRKYKDKINLLNSEINKLKMHNADKIYELEQDIEYFIISSKQREEIFEQEYEDNVKRYDYQISAAKESYNQNIDASNAKLIKKKVAVDEAYALLLHDYDEETERMLKTLNDKIESLTVELNTVTYELETFRTKMKEKFRQESILLNDEIRLLIDSRNNNIVNARARYNKSLNDSAIEKENKRQEYQQESQRIQKDFVYNITQIDEQANENKKAHTAYIENKTRALEYQLFDIHKEKEREILQILDSSSSTEDDLNKNIKSQIKHKNKQYFKARNQKIQMHDQEIKYLNKNYNISLEKNRNNKALLDLDRMYSLKVFTEKEQRDNKYYQELSNIYENDSNLLIKIANMKYNQKANLVKCQSRIRIKELEKEQEITEADYQKKIEKIQTKINALKLEIDGALKLKNSVVQYEKTNYDNKTNNLTVNTLLEIEKSRLLNQYNHRQYEINVLNSRTNLMFSKRKLQIENEQFEAISKIKIEQLNSALARDIINAAYKIKEEQLFEAEDKQVQNRNNQYDLDSINHTVLHKRFNGEIRLIHQILSTFVLLITELDEFITKVLTMFFNSIKVRPEYVNIIRTFIIDFYKIINDYYSDLLISLYTQEEAVINDRIEFEEKFKFKSFYNDILANYEAERKRLISKQKSIADTSENYSKTIEMFKSRIYNLDNQNNAIKQRIKNPYLKDDRPSLQNEYKANKQKKMDFEQKINDIMRLKNILLEDNKAINNDLKALETDYTKRINEIKKMQFNNAHAFFNLKKELEKYTTSIATKYKISFFADKAMQIKYYDLDGMIANYQKRFSTNNVNLFTTLYKIVDEFNEKACEAISKDKKLLLLKMKNDISHIHEQTSLLIDENRKEYDKKVEQYIAELEALHVKEDNTEKKFNDILLDNEESYNDDVKEILKEKKESQNKFYREFYAMCDNLEDININYSHEKNDLTSSFDINKLTLANDISNEKKALSERLVNFIKDKNEFINQLPQAIKFQTTQLNKETKDLNSQIEIDLKNEKTNFNLERKNIMKNISLIDSTLSQTLVTLEDKHQVDILKEKRNHNSNLKHITGNITN